MSSSLLPFIKKLISVRSVQGDSKALHEVLELALSQLSGFTIERFEDKGVPSALVYASSKRPKRFQVLLSGHLDVVPGKEKNYIARLKSDRLYGVGSMDMKANTACLISVFKEMANSLPYSLALQLVTDEEIGGFHGAKYQVSRGVRSDFVIAGEPTNFDIVHKAKGVIWLKISTIGETAHGAYPWRGKNAIWQMMDFLEKFKKIYPIPRKEGWVTTCNVARIETSNQSINKIPDDCSVYLDIRCVPEDARLVLKNIKKILPKGFTLSVIENEPALATNTKDPHLVALEKSTQSVLGKKTLLRGANGTSDARHFAGVGCPGVEFGPVGGDIGGDDEWVSVSSLDDYCKILKHFLSSLS